MNNCICDYTSIVYWPQSGSWWRAQTAEAEEPNEDGSYNAGIFAAAWGALVTYLAAIRRSVPTQLGPLWSAWPWQAWNPSPIVAAERPVYTAQWTPPSRTGMPPFIDAFLSSRENLLVRTSESVFDEVRSVITRAVHDGLSERQASALVRSITNPDTTDIDWRSRAQRIARTETHAAQQGGAYDWVQHEVLAGVMDPPERHWLAAGDVRTRPWHMNVPPAVWPSPFIVDGEALRYPGDSRGSARNVINCRCGATRVAPVE